MARQTSSTFDGMAIALQRIAEEAEHRTGKLDLSGLGLEELPEALFELTHLRELDLGIKLNIDCNCPCIRIDAQRRLMGRLIHLESLSVWSSDLSSLDFAEALSGLKSLDCCGTPVSDLSALSGLSGLQMLKCSFTPVSDLSALSGLSGLQMLDCSNTGVSDLSALSGLSGLQTLDCSATSVSDLSALSGLSGLQTLYCFGTPVSNLSALSGLSGLQTLYCSNTGVSDLSALSGLSGLQMLDCSETPVSDLSALSGLSGLQMLDCSEAPVSDLSALSGLSGLQTLDCSYTLVSDLSALSGLSGLKTLYCRHTPVSDLSALSGLSGLRTLDCSGTPVSDLSVLSGLSSLYTLDCSWCTLISLPLGVLSLPSLGGLILCGTNVPGLPPGVLSTHIGKNCLDSLRAHFADLATESAEMPGVKLLLLGNGGAGKTKIAGWLSGKDYGTDDWDSTHGIEIGETDLPGEPPTRLQIWDFGGQDIYHGAHALFLRSPAVLAAVWATDTEANKTHTYDGLEFRNQPLAYWVEIARRQGHRGSPLLILQSKCDAPEDEARRLPLPDDTPYFKSLQVSAKADRYKAALLDTLAEAVKYLRDPQRMGTVKIGAGRLRVRQRLEAMRAADRALPPDRRRHRLLTMAEFEQICAEEGGVSAPEHLLTWLDADGAVLYRPGLLRDRIVLDQNWALEAVYAVFHRNSGLWSEIRRCNGRFTQSMLDRFVWQGHSAEDQALFLDLMRSCGICFRHREFDQGGEAIVEYIAPDLLPERSEIADRLPVFWDEERAGERAVFRYPLLHDGLIRTIVAALGERAGPDALYWRGGLCGFEATTGSRFRIEMQRPDPDSWPGEIHLRTQGGRAAELLARLVQQVEWAQSRFGLRAETVEPPVKPSLEDKQDMSFALPPSPPAAADQWYVSYAWGDKTPEGRERERIVDDLCAAAADGGRTILRDKNVLGLCDSISNFMRQIGAGDRVFVILSDKYLRSPYCMFELSEIWRTSLRQETFLERVRVYALPETKIWDPCDWADWAIHWKTEYEALDARAREHGAAVLGRHGNDRLRQMQFFYTQVADILGTLADIVQPRTFDELKAYGLDDKPAS